MQKIRNSSNIAIFRKTIIDQKTTSHQSEKKMTKHILLIYGGCSYFRNKHIRNIFQQRMNRDYDKQQNNSPSSREKFKIRKTNIET